jgi:hypothetical protein
MDMKVAVIINSIVWWTIIEDELIAAGLAALF